eukprot:3328669-Rhodomonas_salina.2
MSAAHASTVSIHPSQKVRVVVWPEGTGAARAGMPGIGFGGKKLSNAPSGSDSCSLCTRDTVPVADTAYGLSSRRWHGEARAAMCSGCGGEASWTCSAALMYSPSCCVRYWHGVWWYGSCSAALIACSLCSLLNLQHCTPYHCRASHDRRRRSVAIATCSSKG